MLGIGDDLIGQQNPINTVTDTTVDTSCYAMPRYASKRRCTSRVPAVRQVRVEIAFEDDPDDPQPSTSAAAAPAPAVGDSDWDLSDSDEGSEYRPTEEDSGSDDDTEEDLDYVSLHNSSIDSDAPLSEVRLSRNQPGSEEWTWRRTSNVPTRYGFDGTPGVKVDHLDADSSAREVFDCFFTPALWATMEEETNRYARQNPATPSRKMAPWKPVSEEELQSYLGLRILMGIQPRPSYRDYWSTNRLFGCEGMYRSIFLLHMTETYIG